MKRYIRSEPKKTYTVFSIFLPENEKHDSWKQEKDGRGEFCHQPPAKNICKVQVVVSGLWCSGEGRNAEKSDRRDKFGKVATYQAKQLPRSQQKLKTQNIGGRRSVNVRVTRGIWGRWTEVNIGGKFLSKWSKIKCLTAFLQEAAGKEWRGILAALYSHRVILSQPI